MGSGSSKQKADVSTNTETIQQKIQPIQAKPQELKKDDQTNKYNQAKPNNITYNKIVEIPKKDLPIVKTTNQYDNSIQKKQINQGYCDQQKQHRNLQKKEDQNIQQRNDQQNIDYKLQNNGLINMKKNAPEKKMQQYLENIKIGNQRQQFNLNNNQENAGKSPFRAANLSFQADKDEKIKELNLKKLQQPIQNTFYNYQSPQLLGQKPIQKPGKNQYLPALFQEQQRKEEIRYKPQQNIKILEIIELDYIDIYNQIFNKKTSGRFSNQFPCKHSECKTVARINIKGDVTCENGCASFSINQAIFYNKNNTISCFNKNKVYDYDNYNLIKNEMELVQILLDSLKCSNKTESEKEKFQIQLIQVVFNHYLERKRSASIS